MRLPNSTTVVLFSLSSAITSSHLTEELPRNLNTNGFKLE